MLQSVGSRRVRHDLSTEQRQLRSPVLVAGVWADPAETTVCVPQRSPQTNRGTDVTTWMSSVQGICSGLLQMQKQRLAKTKSRR